MKKITIYALHLGYGGVEKYVITLANILSKSYHVTIISTYESMDVPGFKLSDRVSVEYLINDIPNPNHFKEIIRSKKVFPIITNSLKNISLLIQKYYKNIKSIKQDESDIIITTRIFHNNLVKKHASKSIIKIATEHNHPLSEKYEKKLIRSIKCFDAFVPISKYLENYYKDKIKHVYITSIPFFIEKVDEKIPEMKRDFVFVGRLEPEKKVMDAIRFIELIDDESLLYICGDGSQKSQAEHYVKLNNLSNRVFFLGFINEDLFNVVKHAQYMLVTSERESFGIAALEAMMLETIPLVYPSAKGVVDILESFPELVSEESNVDSMVETYKNINYVNHSKLQKSLITAANGYDKKTMQLNFEKLIIELQINGSPNFEHLKD